MARSRREGNTLAAISRQAWEGRPLSVMNRKQLKASASHIAIIGHVAPREFRDRLADADLAGGTYNRYLPVYVERGKLLAVPEPVAETDLAGLAARLSRRDRRGQQGRRASRSAAPRSACGLMSCTRSSLTSMTQTTSRGASSPAAPRPTACASPGCTPRSTAAP